MRIQEENRNIFLLTAVTLCCGAVAGTLTLFDPVPGPALGSAPERPADVRVASDVNVQTPVRVVGAPFELNVNPRQR
ncbi:MULTISPECIES: hypothetical protein [Bradyrhizobium]|jgi:hypothetical protein|uniref:hypothetical protein n=1 Tax=Bradyrhizobium TaxID=374 RepID=UPI0020139CE0|nr:MULTISPECIES: hypothetical protein [Bradyrhizobium]WOH76410.1 hypothetical protein RX330_15490 [Bradyrhizobium sp. NDS-1]